MTCMSLTVTERVTKVTSDGIFVFNLQELPETYHVCLMYYPHEISPNTYPNFLVRESSLVTIEAAKTELNTLMALEEARHYEPYVLWLENPVTVKNMYDAG